ncbi:MAG: hypothetical protein ACKPE3_38690 [Sphaerospermopsis kisseleviana]
MKPKLDKLASFRINSERWEKFKEVAENQDKTATDLLNEYIDRVIGVGVGVGVADAPKLPIQDIDKRIDVRISAAMQEIDKRIDDKLNKTSIQDIDNTVQKLIANSLVEGDVGDAIAKLQRKFADENNELQSQIYALQKSLDELKQEILSKIDNISQNSSDVPSPQSPVTSHQSSVTSHQSSVTSPQLTEEQKLEIIELLGLGGIINGEIYYQQLLVDQQIAGRIHANLEKLDVVGIKFSGRQKTSVARINHILNILGFSAKNIGQKSIRGKSGIECYQVRI